MPKKLRPIVFFSHLAIVMLLVMGSCNQEKILLAGAGATLPEPLYNEMFFEYEKTHILQIHYYGLGSELGMTQLKERNVDFGCTDILLKEELASESKDNNPILVPIPVCLGAVAITYNIPGNPRLQLTSRLLAAILMGRITFWNDVQIKQHNQNINLPAEKIQVFYRLEGSGTTYILADYLSKASQEWAATMGKGAILYWKTGTGCQGSTSLAMEVVKREYSIGYLGLSYAIAKGLPVAAIQNRSGAFIEPTVASISAAAEGLTQTVVTTGSSQDLTLFDTASAAGYPLSSFSYLLLHQEQKYNERKREHARALCELVWWMIHEGQRFNDEQYYAKLPPRISLQAEAALKTITYDNQPVMR